MAAVLLGVGGLALDLSPMARSRIAIVCHRWHHPSTIPDPEWAKTQDCSGLDETACLANPRCRGVYGPSCLTCKDVVHQGCADFPVSEREQAAIDRWVCTSTGGSWLESKGKYGTCACSGGMRPGYFGCG